MPTLAMTVLETGAPIRPQKQAAGGGDAGGRLPEVAPAGPEDRSGFVLVVPDRTGARRTQGRSRLLFLWWSAHLPADWTDWLFDRPAFGRAIAAADRRLSGNRGIPAFVVLAQAFLG